MKTIQFREALREAMSEEMRRDSSVFLLGEEVAEYNGAYKVSQGMLDEFGPKRVIDTPIAELGFAGIAVGASMNGLRPIVEFMTWNFAILAADQIINSAAKMLQMSGGQYHCPIVFRGGNGTAGQLAATHSQSFEAFYAHVPGLKVITPSNPADAKGLLKAAIRDNDPVIFMESEQMYGDKMEIPEGEYIIPIGVADIKREGTDVTIVSFGKIIKEAYKAADQLAAARGRMARAGIDTATVSDDDLRAFMAAGAQAFRDSAPMSAAEASAFILASVQRGDWRILVGDDAVILDEMVRENPKDAYLPDFHQQVQARGALGAIAR